MNKICTSIEQSRKLIELGIDINTADMIYHKYIDKPHPNDMSLSTVFKDNYKYYWIDILDESYNDNEDIQSWSLTALLELMPSRVNDTYKLNLIKDDTTNGYYYNYTNRKERRLRTSFASHNPLDAAFEMVCWLLENNKI